MKEKAMFTAINLFIGTALFHTYGGGGILAGFLHPLLGLDHLLAMLAIGFLSAQIGGRSIWSVPVAFVGMMALGAILGIVGIEIPFVEYGITGSVLILGIAILAYRGLPEWTGLMLAAIFGFFHGHAHGTEIPELTSTAGLLIAYIAGFLVATAGLHVIGALVGIMAIRSERGKMAVRAFGGLIAVIGVILILQV
ncbi:MAG: urease accessory protein [Cellvibrionaceae bacterium]